MRVVSDKNGMLEMSIINVIFLTNVEKWGRSCKTSGGDSGPILLLTLSGLNFACVRL